MAKRQLDLVWHTTSWKTKQLVEDLQQLRELLSDLMNHDAVSFLRQNPHFRVLHRILFVAFWRGSNPQERAQFGCSIMQHMMFSNKQK